MAGINDEMRLFEERWKKPGKLSHDIEGKLKRKGAVTLLGSTPLPTKLGGWTYMVFGDYTTGEFHTALVYGDAKKNLKKDNVLLRVHSACATSELFHATNCECREELDEAMKRIKRHGSGMIIYMNQEGAGNGIAAKVAAYSHVFEWRSGKVVNAKGKDGKPANIYDAYRRLGYEPESRSFLAAAGILKYLGIKSVRLMTNNPKKIEELRKYGIKVEPEGIHIKPANAMVKEHLKAKSRVLGHAISEKDLKR